MIVGRVESRADVDRFSHRRSRCFRCLRYLNPASPEVLHRQGCCMCVVLPSQSQVKIVHAGSVTIVERSSAAKFLGVEIFKPISFATSTLKKQL